MIAVERSEVMFGSTRIAYAVRRSARRATVSIAIDPMDGVLLTAPESTPLDRLDRVVHDKARWIVERLRRRRDLEAALPAREFVSGESFLYLGRQYRLRVERAAEDEERVGLRRGWLVVPVPRALLGTERPGYVRKALVSWFREHAAERMPERARVWAERLGVAEPRVLVREQDKRWGSCDARGTVRLNWRAIQAPMRLLDYVVAHELVHLEHPDHTRAFWARLGGVMPDYEARKAALRAMGARMVW